METHFYVPEWKSATYRLCLSTLALNQDPQTCHVGLSAKFPSGVAPEVVLGSSCERQLEAHLETLKTWVWWLDLASRWKQAISGKECKTTPIGRSNCGFRVSRRRAKACWLTELLAVSELNGSCQTKPQAVQAHSANNGRKRRKIKRKSLLCS